MKDLSLKRWVRKLTMRHAQLLKLWPKKKKRREFSLLLKVILTTEVLKRKILNFTMGSIFNVESRAVSFQVDKSRE